MADILDVANIDLASLCTASCIAFRSDTYLLGTYPVFTSLEAGSRDSIYQPPLGTQSFYIKPACLSSSRPLVLFKSVNS